MSRVVAKNGQFCIRKHHEDWTFGPVLKLNEDNIKALLSQFNYDELKDLQEKLETNIVEEYEEAPQTQVNNREKELLNKINFKEDSDDQTEQTPLLEKLQGLKVKILKYLQIFSLSCMVVGAISLAFIFINDRDNVEAKNNNTPTKNAELYKKIEELEIQKIKITTEINKIQDIITENDVTYITKENNKILIEQIKKLLETEEKSN